MALQSNAALLDELMGKNRNVAPGANVSQTRYDDDDVCKHFLVSFCPHELFVNTRADLGPCTKSHDEALKLKYQQSSKYGRLGYEDDFERFLRSLLGEVERKIKRGQERLKLTQPSDSSGKTALQVKRERLAVVKEEINKLIKQAEELGEQGCIEEAQNVIQECDKFKSECKHLESQIDLATGNNPDGKQMEVCDVCGSFLIINDSSSRIEEHNNGKQHQGYAKLRAALEELRKRRMEELEKREKEREARDKGRDKDKERRRSKSRDRHHRRSSRDRDGRRGSSRDRRKSSRSPVRRRSRSRDRDRAVDSSHRSHHRDRKRTRSRSRSRDRKHSNRHSRGSEERNGNNGVDHRSHSKSSQHQSTDSDSRRDSKSRKIDQEADEFMKLADDITNGGTKRSEESKNGSTNGEKVKKPKKNGNEEKEEGEEDDEEYDE